MRRSLIPGVVLAEGRSRVMRFLLGRAGVLHIRGRRLRGRIPSFPHDSVPFLERRFPVEGLPCAQEPALHMGEFQRR